MHYDVVIIGASMSGLAAGIRLAQFDKRVCIVEKHYAYGGLNSYYKLDGREFDVGLHAVTNYVPPDDRLKPLNKLLRQLRLTREDFDLRPQRYSEVRFPDRRLRFSNNVDELVDGVATLFPRDVDRFRSLLSDIRAYDDIRQEHPYQSTREVLADRLTDPALIEMLLCPLMYYGCAEEDDMEFTQFVTMFKAIFLQGFARPCGGVRTILKALVKRYRACGGKLQMNCGVEGIDIEDGRVSALTLSPETTVTADVVLSSAGYFETMRLCSGASGVPRSEQPGRVSFVESIAVLNERPSDLGHDATIVFYNDAETFDYQVPRDSIDPRSGVVCCPGNYEACDESGSHLFRSTWLASYPHWAALDSDAYAVAKRSCEEQLVRLGERYIPGFGDHIEFVDTFTPCTIERFTGRINGAVYGAPRKRRDGRTHLSNLFLCGTDQGFLGIIGAMLSGITIANRHVLMGE